MDFSLNKNWLEEWIENRMTCKISIFIQKYLNFKSSHTNAENFIKILIRIACLSKNILNTNSFNWHNFIDI